MNDIQQTITMENNENKKDFFKEVVEQTNAIGDEINNALKSIKTINSKTNTLSISAKIEASRLGDKGKDFLVVSNSIDTLSTQTNEVIEKMKTETIKDIDKLASVIESKSVSITGNRLATLALTNIRLVDRSLFERAADIRWWATDDIIIKSLSDETIKEYDDVKSRLAVMLKSYTVYHELILCDIKGNCKATGEDKYDLIGKKFSDKSWFTSAMNSKDGTEYGYESVHLSKNIGDITISFSCKVHEGGDIHKKPIGVLAAVFKWKEFAQRILEDTAISKTEKENTRILLCDDSGKILADTDKNFLEQINFTGKKELFKKEKGFTVIKENNRFQLISHALSPGFEGYKSAEWHSLIIQDLDMQSHDADTNISNDGDDSLDSISKLVVDLSDETQKATDHINEINDQMQILSLNAAIESSKAGEEGRGFSVISESMGDLSRDSSKITNTMSSQIHQKIINLNDFISSNSRQIKGERLSNLSFTNVDLIDRALYERTADVRWWATDHSMIDSLVQKTDENIYSLETKLKTILRYYTVYEDLMIVDNDGNIITTGSGLDSFGSNVSNCTWFQNAKRTSNGNDYCFDVIKTKENKQDKIQLVFSCKIHKNGDASQDSIGILGIFFKWEKFIETIFNETPLSEDEKENTSLYIADGNCDFLALVERGDKKVTHKKLLSLFNKTKNFGLLTDDEYSWLSGHASSVGYEGFSTKWHALIVEPVMS